MQNASLPMTFTTPAPLLATSCICVVMSAVPGGTRTRSYSRPAFSKMPSTAPDSNSVSAAGTSMVTKATWSTPSSSATATGTPISVDSGLTMTKLVSVSASMSSLLFWK